MVKVKGLVLAIALLTVHEKTREQQRFTITILEVAADWHELVIPWRIVQPSIARESEQYWTSGAARQIYYRPNQTR